MGIFYGMLARGNVVLAEFSAMPTNASAIARQILERTQQGIRDSNASYSHDRYIFHVKRTDGLTVLCMADDAFGRKFTFLHYCSLYGSMTWIQYNWFCVCSTRAFMSFGLINLLINIWLMLWNYSFDFNYSELISIKRMKFGNLRLLDASELSPKEVLG